MEELSQITVVEGHEANQHAFAIGVTKVTIERILRLDRHRADALALYLFYAYTARWQHTNEVWATNSYVCQGLGWGVDKLKLVKRVLKELGLISDSQPQRGKGGRLVRWTLRVNYFVTSGVISPPLVETAVNRDELLSIKKKETNTYVLPSALADLTDTWAEWLRYKRERRNPMTPTTCKLQVAKLLTMGVEHGRAAMLLAMERGWQGFGFDGYAPLALKGKTLDQLDKMESERRGKINLMTREYGQGARETGKVGKQMKALEAELREIRTARNVILDKLI